MQKNNPYIFNSKLNELLTIIILTKNESIHIERAVNCAKEISENVYVIDSDSTDDTKIIASNLGAKLFNASFSSFSEKLNWCINELEIETPWVLRLDADEYIDKKYVSRLFGFLFNNDINVTGVYLRRQLWFVNHYIRFGGLYPNYTLRLWRNRSVMCESRILDEHLMLKHGKSIKLKADIIDNPLTPISTWITKHNNYSILEANTITSDSRINIQNQIKVNLLGTNPERKRWLKSNLYNNFPLFIRPFFYFIYRYIFLFGFLDGIPGFLYHFYHAFWYRLLVDTIIYESKKKSNKFL
jgi:hypothetical protein